MTREFKELFETIKIGTMEVKNRIVMCPMGTTYASVSGAVTQRMIDYYTERAKGGVGLIIVEGTCIEGSLGRPALSARAALIDHNCFIAGFYDLVRSVHHYGTKIAIQLQHAGAWAKVEPGSQPVSASEILREDGLKSRALTTGEIEELEENFAEAAGRARVAGFDSITVNGGAGFLINQFLSPLSNKRNDLYGGSLEGRMRFATEIIKRIRQRVGAEFPIIFDHPADEFVEGGINLEESTVMAQRLEELGVCAFRMHSGIRDPKYVHWIACPAPVPEGFQVRYAEQTKNALSQAKVMVGRQIQNPEFAKAVIVGGKADLIILGRPLLADPELPKKWADGRPDDVRRCLRCNECRWNELKGLPVVCTVNPALGREKEYGILPAAKAKKVLIVGGGPGGMEAARVAALRGHEVTLFEKADRLGGQLRLASVSPHKDELGKLADHLASQVGKAGVKIELEKEASEELVLGKNPDVVVLAAGAMPLIPNISGVDRKIVTTAWEILGGGTAAGKRVIVIGGGHIGLETAEYVAEKGKAVIVLEQLTEAGLDIEPMTRMLLIQRLAEYGAEIITNARVIEIKDDGVVFFDNEERKSAEADTVVLATGARSNNQLEGLRRGEWEFYSIGDCASPRSCMEAIQEGYWVGSQI